MQYLQKSFSVSVAPQGDHPKKADLERVFKVDRKTLEAILTSAILLARDQYYNRTPVISDKDFDEIVDIKGRIFTDDAE